MPLTLEQDSEELLAEALQRLRSKMQTSTGAYEQPGADSMDRELGTALETYKARLKGIRPWETEAGLRTELLDPVQRSLGALPAASSRPAGNAYSGPMFNEGSLGQVELATGQFRPVTLPGQSASGGLPPGYSPSRFMAPAPPQQPFAYAGPSLSDSELASTPPMSGLGVSPNPGFVYMGSLSGESAARDAYGKSRAGQQNYLRSLPLEKLRADYPEAYAKWFPQLSKPDQPAPKVIPIPGNPGLSVIEFSDGRQQLIREPAEGGQSEGRVTLRVPQMGDRSFDPGASVSGLTLNHPLVQQRLGTNLQTGPVAAPVAPNGGVRVMVEKDGKRFTLPAEQVAEAEKQGYRRVK